MSANLSKMLNLFPVPETWKIPQMPATGCPAGTHQHFGTCCCKHGCCWSWCVADDPNNLGDCLKGTGAKWVRNNATGGWMAQVRTHNTQHYQIFSAIFFINAFIYNFNASYESLFSF